MATLPLSPLELALLQPFTVPALEALRVRFMYNATTDHVPETTARAVVQMAYDTEIRAPLSKTGPIAPGVAAVVLPTRRRFLEIDADMTPYSFLIEPALQALETSGILPPHYVRLVRTFVNAPYPKYRMSGIAAILCFTAAKGL